MEMIIENLESMVASYDDPDDPNALKNQCELILSAVNEDVSKMISDFPDNVAFGIFPFVKLTEKGKMFLNHCNVVEDDLPNWEKIRDQKFFTISGESDFIRALPETDEDTAVKILFAIVIVKERV